MLNQVLAIDVFSRIPNFAARMAKFSHEPSLFFDSAKDVHLSPDEAKKIDGLVVSIYEPISLSLLQGLPSLRYIGVLGTSSSQIPLAICSARFITVKAVDGYCDHETAEWCMMTVLEWFRRSKNPKSAFLRKFGVIGVGAVGKLVIELALAARMKVMFNARSSHDEIVRLGAIRASKEEIFSECDIVSLHTPPQQCWLTKQLLSKSNHNLCIVNTCLGRVADQEMLFNFLSQRTDVKLILDKVASEAYPNLRNVALCSDEAAYKTADSKKRLVDKFFANIADFTGRAA